MDGSMRFRKIPAWRRKGQEAEDSAAVFPGGPGDGERLDSLKQLRLDDLEDNDSMVAVFFANVHDAAFQVGVEVLENGSGCLAFEEGFAIQGDSIGFGGRKELLRDRLLVTSQYMQSGDAALVETPKYGAVFSHRGHQKRRFEGGLGNPGDGGSTEGAAVARRENVHPVGEQTQGFLFGFGFHISPGKRKGLYANAES